MSLTKQIIIDQIMISETGVVNYREATKIFENEKEISKTYHRTLLTPGQDLTGHPSNVATICNAVWTAEVIENYKNLQNQIM